MYGENLKYLSAQGKRGTVGIDASLRRGLLGELLKQIIHWACILLVQLIDLGIFVSDHARKVEDVTEGEFYTHITSIISNSRQPEKRLSRKDTKSTGLLVLH